MKLTKKILAIALLSIFSIVIVACDTSTTKTPTTLNPTTSLTTSDQTNQITTEEITTSTTYSTLQTTEAPTTFTTTTESVITYTGIELVSSKKFYRLNDTYDTISIEIIAHKSDGSVENLTMEDLSVRGLRTSTVGKQNFLVIFDKFFLEVDYIVLEDFAFEINMAYYEDAINLNGNALKLALNNIINEGFNNLLYGDARYILDEADADPNNPGNIILVYTGMSVSGAWDGGTTWNREHVWPQSRLGVYVGYDEDDFPSKATDLHNLKPADPDENALRSNDYFDWFKTDKTYEPRDEVKGDIARILFYMATMYFELTLNNDELSLSLNRTMGILSVLLEWNEIDPVDDFERNRNEVIYSYQNNRNPFIDYPEFANLIWGDLAA
ncbi:MAG: endonuclease [Candidatus Izemoplasmatales bacterium]|jgi:endonuclease I|nr:endonuclease [Candidatus Izemoplasmatales bacterium]